MNPQAWIKKKKKLQKVIRKIGSDSQKMIKIDEWTYILPVIMWYKSFLYLVRFIKLIPSFDKGIYMYWY